MLRQPSYLGLTFLPRDSRLAQEVFPDIATPGAQDELTVISDEGGVYRGGDAWIMCLYALVAYREWSLRLAHPALRPWARQAFALVSSRRSRIAHWLHLASEAEIAETLQQVAAPPCEIQASGTNGSA
jgi:hypothetical protein